MTGSTSGRGTNLLVGFAGTGHLSWGFPLFYEAFKTASLLSRKVGLFKYREHEERKGK